MRIMVNGRWHSPDEPVTVGQLLESMDLEPRRVAVELNRQILPRVNYTSTQLGDADE